jgi:uncharacterized protein HemX
MNLLQNVRMLLARLGMGMVVVAMVAAGFVLSAMFFAVFMAAGVVVGGWLWWQTRRLQKQQRAQFLDGDYVVIETEYELLEDRSRDRHSESRRGEQAVDDFEELARGSGRRTASHPRRRRQPGARL